MFISKWNGRNTAQLCIELAHLKCQTKATISAYYIWDEKKWKRIVGSKRAESSEEKEEEEENWIYANEREISLW